MLTIKWNIDEIQPGQLFVVELNAVYVHEWDEANEILRRRTDCLPIGTCIFLSKTWLRYKWKEPKRMRDLYRSGGFMTSDPVNKVADFHQFIHGEKFVLLDRKDIDALELPQFSMSVL